MRFAQGTRGKNYLAYNIKKVKVPSYHSIYENACKLYKNIFDRVFWFKYIFPIKYKIRILDLMLLPKNSVHLKGYTTIGECLLISSLPGKDSRMLVDIARLAVI